MTGWVWFAVGAVVGGWAGMMLVALCVMAGDDDDRPRRP